VSLDVEVDPNLKRLLTAVGLMDASGHVDTTWFNDPLGGVRRVLSDPEQRAALVDLLQDLVGSQEAALAAAEWLPLLDTGERGNVYLTVDGSVVGVAAAYGTPPGADPAATASLRLPLVEAGDELRVLAGTADGPLALVLTLALADGPFDALNVSASVDLEGHAAFAFTLEGIDVGAGPETLTVSSDDLGRDLVHAAQTLVADALSDVPGADRVAAHLLGALGLDGVLPVLPLERLASDPSAARDWLAEVAGTPAHLRAWFAHVAGLLGADAPTNADPLTARLVALAAGADLRLRAEVAGGDLLVSLAATAAGAPARLEASATLLAIPLSGTAPVRVVPEAAVRVRAPASDADTLIDVTGPPVFRVGGLSGGVTFDGAVLSPELFALNVDLEGAPYPRLDLTDVNAVVGAVTAGVRDAIADVLGDTGPGRALLALTGIAPPRTDPLSTNLVQASALASGPVAAIAAVHRTALSSAAHPWSHMLGELGRLLGLSGPVSGAGTAADPWRVEIDTEGALRLDLAGWDAGGERLRIGVLATATAGPWSTRLLSELLAFDLAAGGVRVIGEQRLELALDPVPDAGAGTPLVLGAGALRAVAGWRPGAPLGFSARAEDLTVTVDGVAAGPVTLTYPPPDPAAPDLGLGAAVDELLELLRALARHALQAWGGDGAAAVGALLGLGGDGPPLAPPDAGDLRSLFARPGDALRERTRALLCDLDADGEPFADRALAQLGALLRDQVPRAADAFATRLDVPLTGAGTYAAPWALPLVGEEAEALLWLEPAGPPATWAAGLAQRVDGAADAATLVGLLPRVAGLLDDLPRGADAAGLEALAAWLADGDGLSALSSQLPGLAGWAQGAPLRCAHADQPRDPAAIAAIRAQLDAWADEDGGRAVLLLGSSWDDLLAAAEPGRPTGAHFTADPATVTAVATHYTADAGGDLGAMVDRIAALTGRPRVVLVAHGTPGVAARAFAAGRPEPVRGIITLGTPHLGEPPAPLTEPGLAEAVRALAHVDLPAPLRSALATLEAALDALPGAPALADFVPLPAGLPNPPVDGLALGSALGGGLVEAVAAGLAARLRALDAAARPAPTHVGVGVRVHLPLAVADAEIGATARVDAGRVRLAPAAAEPPRPAQAATAAVTAASATAGGWLAGDPTGAGPRVRSAEAGVRIVPAPGGALAVEPTLVLHDVSLGGVAARDVHLDDPRLADAIDLVAQATGAHVAPDAVAELQAAPAALVRENRDALLDALDDALGGLSVQAAGVELSLDRATGSLRLRTVADLDLGEGVTLGADGRIALATMTPSLAAHVTVGAVSLTYDGRLTLAAEPWLRPLVLLPPPTPAALEAALVPLAGRVAVSAALSALLGELLDVRGTVAALDPLLENPGERLAQLTPADVQAILQAAASALGVDPAGGLPLPGGFTLRATGAADLRLELTGTLPLDAAGDELRLALALEVDQDRRVTGDGTITADVDLPAPTWGRLQVEFGAGVSGARLTVTPENAPAITLLPQFSGFGDLVAAGAVSLLPHLLQAIVDELSPPSPLLAAVLDVADALGIYADDADGFETPARAAALAAMLEPGWIEAQVANGAAIAALIEAIFDQLPLPLGTVSANAATVDWTAAIPGGGTVSAAVTLGAAPAVAVTLADFDAGPLVVETARAGFDGDLDLDVALRLDPPGELAFLAPVFTLGVDGAHVSASLLPLGAGARADLELTLAPVPDIVFTEQGALDLVTAWGVPLVALFGLKAAADVLDDALWENGPTTNDVLESAGLITAAGALAQPLPALDALALGLVEGLATNITVDTGVGLEVSVVDDGTGRKGVRVTGEQTIEAGDLDVAMSFGAADWLDDDDAGVTLWILRPVPGTLPSLDLGIDVVGVGAMLAGHDGTEPLVDSPLTIGRAGGFVFASLDLQDATGTPALTVSELGGAVDLRETRIVVSAGDGDSLVQKLLPPELQAPFWLAVEAHQGRGVELHGGIGSTPGLIELTFPLDLDIGGVVQLDEVYVSAGRDGATTALVAAISGGAKLGPVAVAVQRVGARVRFGPGGPQLEFKLPDGLGLSITSPTLRLGGFLLIDQARGRYVGAIEIAIVEKFALVAIGIITTKRPDGTPLFSLLILVSITFPVPIPLGYGFFFAGAGGLLGLNRGIDLDRLRLGLRSGSADSILFPTDIIARIDDIVRDLEEVFPIAEGRFLIAPMGMITWSTPALISAKVGLIIEIGSPLRLGLLGVIALQLPTPDAAVVSIKVAFLGALDIPGSMLSFDASIYDSYLGYDDFKLSLEGDIALRVCWGAQPDFVTSVGGFHPSFHPGAHLRLPPMRRMSLSLLKDNPRVTMGCYFAITTNTVQFGARVELFFGVEGFSISGDLGFDVLVQIVPLHLEANMWARLAVKAGGHEVLTVGLDLSLTGPGPWIAKGTGRFKVIFEVKVHFRETLGEAAAPEPLPLLAVLDQLLPALRDEAAWTAELDAAANALVHLIAPPAGTLVIDAAGLLTVSQRVLPLGTDFSRFGTAQPSDVTRVDVEALRVGPAGDAVETRPVTDAFAPAAFQALSDEDKLRAPAFEQRAAGVQSTTGADLETDAVVVLPVEHEMLVFDVVQVAADGAPRPPFDGLVRGGQIGATHLSALATRAAEKAERIDGRPTEERFAVARVGDLSPIHEEDEAPLVSRTDAEQRLAALRASGKTGLQIVPEAQVAA
jgi:uncharacterized protein DUF6603